MSQIKFNGTKTYVGKRSKKGELRDIYSPFFNLIHHNNSQGYLDDFTDEQLCFDREHPVDLTLQDSYDGSVNVIFNDDKNRPRLVNSRFSVQEGKTYLIPDHKGMKDTNLYDSKTFDIDTSLKKVTVKIPKLTFEGLEDGGEMPCGTYTFYFKFADADDNETEVIAESGIVQCHIGKVNDPGKIRMGMEDENSQKIVKFKLTNIDSGFDYVKVLYVRTSTDNSRAVQPTYHIIDYKFPILHEECDIYIRGTETILGATEEDILMDYADINAVKTQEQTDNILFFGNIAKAEHDWDALAEFSRQITASAVQTANIGYLNQNYTDTFEQDPDHAFGYYNMKNVYYRVGYWPDEFYRFGIVYIFNDDSISPVFNILGGIIEGLEGSQEDAASAYRTFLTSGKRVNYEPEDFFYDKDNLINSKGVVRLPKVSILSANKLGLMASHPLSIKFSLSGSKAIPVSDLLEKHSVKGYFFVRQKRIPTIVGQGMVIGKTSREYGSFPVLKNDGAYVTRSFLSNNRIILPNDSGINIPTSHVTDNALLVPDAVLREFDFNQMFVSNDWALDPLGRCSFNYNGATGIAQFVKYQTTDASQYAPAVSKLITVPENTRILTNGETDSDGLIKDDQFFSTMAGNASEPYKAVNTKYAWEHTVPQTLTEDTNYVRGLFGQYVGMSYTDYPYGTILNIKKDQAQTTTADEFNLNEFSSRIYDSSPYYAISERETLTTENTFTQNCFRGDCFISFFTHRIIRNFTDPDLPTNLKIVDPLTWAKNYAVRCTCNPGQKPYSNLKKDYTGWYIPDDVTSFSDLDDFKLTQVEDAEEQSGIIINDEGNGDTDWKAELQSASAYAGNFVNEIAKAFEVYVGKNRKRNNIIRIVHPQDQENQSGLMNLKSLFHSSALWELRGISNMNRGDINAVQIGQWITFPICSSSNICLRDVDSTNTTEEAMFSKKRSFFPLEAKSSANKLADSHVMNGACSVTVPFKPNLLIPDVPFFRQEFNNRVYYSDFDDTNRVRNAYRVFKETNYKDYPKMYGSITKLIELNKQLICVCEHGVLILPVHERIQSGNGQGEIYINQKNVLPEFPIVITDSFGSMWKDSVISTKSGVYGVDTVAKKIWKYNGQSFVNISDLKVQKFLNDHIDLSEFDKQEYVGHINVKTHYNQFKHDVIFTYYNDKPVYNKAGEITEWVPGESWSLCYNEDLEQFTTFYDWIPVESENIDNIWFTFDRDKVDEVYNATGTANSNVNINKAHVDKAFTTLTQVLYLNNRYTKVFNTSAGFNAVTLYINTNGNNVPVSLKHAGRNRSSITINTGTDYKFITFLFNIKTASQVTLQIDSLSSMGVKICEPKITSISEDDKEFRQLLAEINKPGSFRAPIIVDPNTEPRFISLRTNDDRFMELWKHGQAGLYDNQGKIKPTNWYGKQHEFNFEFVCATQTSMQKIFNNLKIISNSAEPYKFEYEIDGESYNWSEYKDIIEWINLNSTDQASFDALYTEVLSSTYGTLRNKYVDFPQLFNRDASYMIAKLPYMKLKLEERKGTKDASIWINEDPQLDSYKDNSSQTCLIEAEPLSEKRVRTEQLANDIKKYGRLRGNMEYLEDAWDVEIRPISFKFAYYENGLKFTSLEETRNRDKYLKVKVRYAGDDLAVIQGVVTLFEYSFA